MVTQLLAGKGIETPSIETCHEDPKKEEKKPEIECKTGGQKWENTIITKHTYLSL